MRSFANAFGTSVVIASLVVLAGCGVTIRANHVDQLYQEMRTPGIYYTLPKTEVLVAVPLLVEETQKGRVGAIYDECLAKCSMKCDFKPTMKLTVLRPEITLRSVPDPKQVYYVTADTASAFESVKHALTLSDTGTLTDVSSTATNTTYEIVTGVVETVLEFAKAGLLFSARIDSQMAKVLKDTKADATPAERPKPPKIKDDAKSIDCTDFNKIVADLKRFDNEITAQYAQLDELLSPARRSRLDPDFVKLAGERIRERITALKDELLKYREKAELEPTKKKYNYKVQAAQAVVPVDFCSEKHEYKADPPAPWTTAESARTPTGAPAARACPNGTTKIFGFRVEAPLDETQATAPNIQEILKTLEFSIEAELRPAASIQAYSCQQNCNEGPKQGGYRYRIPQNGALTITSKGKPRADKPAETRQILTELYPIAQYGPVAMLPDKLPGKTGSLEFSMSPTGSLKKVTLGTESVPSTAVTGPLESLTGALEERRKRQDEAAKDALNATKTSLERERDELKAQKEIRDLKKELGL